MLTLLVWQYVGKETRGRFLLNGCQWRRGFTMLNKQLFRGNSLSFNESTAYLLILNIFYTKQYIWIELFFEFTLNKCRFIREVTDFFVTGGIQLTALLIRAERLIAFAIISRYEKTQFVNRRGCDYTLSRNTQNSKLSSFCKVKKTTFCCRFPFRELWIVSQ